MYKPRHRKPAKTGYRGVHCAGGKFRACIFATDAKKIIWIPGYHSTAFMAARAYDHYAWLMYGNAAILNFPPLTCGPKLRKITKRLGRPPGEKRPPHDAAVIARICAMKGYASASVTANLHGLSRNAVIGIWHRHSGNGAT